jgi:hypothetical protein
VQFTSVRLSKGGIGGRAEGGSHSTTDTASSNNFGGGGGGTTRTNGGVVRGDVLVACRVRSELLWPVACRVAQRSRHLSVPLVSPIFWPVACSLPVGLWPSITRVCLWNGRWWELRAEVVCEGRGQENNCGEGRRKRGCAAMHNVSDGRQQQQWAEDERRCWLHRVPTIAEVVREEARREDGMRGQRW